MKVISATRARQKFAQVVAAVRSQNEPVGIRRHHRVEAVLMKYPDFLNDQMDEITNVNANSRSFAFLALEPDLYTLADLKKRYV